MSSNFRDPFWWDRETDREGRRVVFVLGDASDAADLMEVCVSRVSRNLDKRNVPSFSQKTPALLMVAFGRELSSYMAKLRRIEPVGDANQFSERLSVPSWANEVELRLDLEKLVRRISKRSRAILGLRDAGYDWNEIAALLGVSVSVAKNGFWRELREARVHVFMPPAAN